MRFTRKIKQPFDNKKWHRWFAWYPIKIGITNDGHHIKLWLEYVERKGYHTSDWDGGYTIYSYREINDEKR